MWISQLLFGFNGIKSDKRREIYCYSMGVSRNLSMPWRPLQNQAHEMNKLFWYGCCLFLLWKISIEYLVWTEKVMTYDFGCFAQDYSLVKRWTVDASDIAWPRCFSKVKRTSFPFFFSYMQLTCFIIDSFNLVLCTFLIKSSLTPRFSRNSLYIFTKSFRTNTDDFSVDDKTSSIIPNISDNEKPEK